jgi:hypothetical protein
VADRSVHGMIAGAAINAKPLYLLAQHPLQQPIRPPGCMQKYRTKSCCGLPSQ